VTGALLVPTCGVLWGAAAGGFTDAPRDTANKDWEKLSGRTASIFHTYHKGDEVFPTKAEIAMTADAAHPRVLLLNWKIAYGSTWAKVAAGQQDKRIDTFAARAKAYGKPFFLVLNHEPENDVIARAGSGMQAKDFAAMYRHAVLRLRAKGVSNAINVVAYMGNEKWMAQSWWNDIYPGDDVVDWMGLDSYVSAEKDYYHYGMFDDLLDRAPTGGGQGWYDWAVSKHPSKPIMVAEWGVYHRVGHKVDKSAGYNSVLPELVKRPAIKAIVYFDTANDDQGDRDISINSTATSLAAFKKLAANPIFNVTIDHGS
jgi:beta-mannanase